MDEMNWSLPPDLEHALERFYSVPEPSPAFAARLEQQLAIRQADLLGAGPALEPRERRSLVHVLLTRLHILKDSAAQPHSPSKPERKSLMLSLRTRPLVVIALALLLLLALTGVVYAVGNLLGYIPGIGIIDHTSQVRVLAEPLSQTRAGVTITVTKAFLGANKALIVFQVDGLSADKYSPLEPLNTCSAPDELRLPNGQTVLAPSGTSSAEKTGYEGSDTFMPVPAGTTQATLFLPCIQGALAAGALPENWELPLRFVPAPPDMTVIPVLDVTRSAAPASNQTETPARLELTPAPSADSGTPGATPNPLAVTQVIDAGDSYILVGALNPPAPQPGDDWSSQTLNLRLVDSNGTDLDFQPASDIELPTPGPHQAHWALKIAKGFAAPVHIIQTTRYVFPSNSQETYTFEFDAGADPRPGQHWSNLNRDFQFAGYPIRLAAIDADVNGYIFSFRTDDCSVVNRLSARIDGYTRTNGGSEAYLGGWNVNEQYSEMPKGSLKVILSDLYLNGETKDWTTDWSPADVPAKPANPAPALIESTPTPATNAAAPNPLALTKVIDLGNSYILIGEFRPPASCLAGGEYLGQGSIKFSDGNGQEVLYDDPPAGLEMHVPFDDLHAKFWAYKIAKGFVPPVHMTYTVEANFAATPAEPYTFEFDAGANPQPGQVWKLDQEFQWAGRTIRLNTITAIKNGYSFSFADDPGISGYELEIAGYLPMDSGGGHSQGEHGFMFSYAEMPKGKLKVILSNLYLKGEKDWTLDWQPGDTFPVVWPAPSATP